jgi:hypothetical protein
VSPADNKAVQALSMFLEDHNVYDIDIEPKGEGQGYTITARRKGNKPAFSSWGKTIKQAVENMVRSISK